MTRCLSLVASALVAAASLAGVAAQSPASGALAFEAVSIKVRTTDGPGPVQAPDRYAQTNTTFRVLVQDAFHLQSFQIVDLPQALVAPPRFDVAAKASFVPTKEQMAVMLQRMLAERFAFRAHMEKRQQSVYVLRLDRADARLGKQITRTTVNCETVKAEQVGNGNGSPRATVDDVPVCGSLMRAIPSPAGMTLRYRASGVSSGDLADWLVPYVRRMVIDRTGLKGAFDVDLSFDPSSGQSPSADSQPQIAAPSVFSALPEQLGLKLEPSTESVDVLVIDHAELPTPD